MTVWLIPTHIVHITSYYHTHIESVGLLGSQLVWPVSRIGAGLCVLLQPYVQSAPFLRPAIFKKVLARSHWPKNTTELDDANDGQLISMWAKGQPWPTQFWAPSRRDSAGHGRYFRWLRWSRTWPSSATLGTWVKVHPHKVVPVVPRSWPSWFITFYNSCF